MKILSKYLSISLLGMSAAFAAPGAHGPNGEHLDAPGGQAQDASGPRLETFTESFELVGKVQGGELSMLIDRYESNEPVLNATLEVEANGLKAPARFHADLGDYAVDDAKFLEALAVPGKHAVIFTLTAGGESDLLAATLEVKAADLVDDHSHSPSRWAVAGGLVATALTALVVALLRRKSQTRK